MKKILLLVVLPFIFLSALSAQITQEQADEIVINHINQEKLPYIIYAKEGLQESMIISTSAGEELELDYLCWVYYINYIDDTCHYLIVNENNGNLLEIKAKSRVKPSGLTEWRTLLPALLGKWELIAHGGYDPEGKFVACPNSVRQDYVEFPSIGEMRHTLTGSFTSEFSYKISEQFIHAIFTNWQPSYPVLFKYNFENNDTLILESEACWYPECPSSRCGVHIYQRIKE